MHMNRRFSWMALDLPLLLLLVSAGLGLIPAYAPESGIPSLIAISLGCGVYIVISRRIIPTRSASLVLIFLGGIVALTFVPRAIGLRLGLGGELYEPEANSVATFVEGILFVGLALFQSNNRRQKWLIGLAVVIMLLAVGLSGSRGAWVAVGLAGLVWAAQRWRVARWLLALTLIGLLSLLLVFIIGGVEAVQPIPLAGLVFFRPDRLELYRLSSYLIQDAPFTGIGLGGQFAMNYSRYVLMIQVPYFTYSHNLFLQVWLEQGLLGLLALTTMAVTIGVRAWRGYRGGGNLLHEVSAAGLLAIYVHGAFDARQMVDLYTWLPFFAMLGMLAAAGREIPGGRRDWLIPAGSGLALLLVILASLGNLQATWSANLGSIHQAQVELGDHPDDHMADRQAAKTLFEQAIAVNPMQRTARLRLGMLLLDERQFEAAVTNLDTAYTADPDNATTWKALGLAYAWRGEIARAAERLQRVPGMAAELNDWGGWWQSQGEVRLARYAYLTSLALAPDQPVIRAELEKLTEE